MALRDLAASRASVNEDTIEELVKEYVRYDVDDDLVVLTSEASKLSIRSKILVFLAANEGWAYVVEDKTIAGATPKEMEDPLGLKGGSLRAKLVDLVRDSLIKKDGKGYRIVSANLAKVRKEVLGR
jgi:hypothetical protein